MIRGFRFGALVVAGVLAFPTFPASTGAPGVLGMNIGIPGRPILES